MDELERLHGETVSLRGNEILRLSEEDAWWIVESGSVGLFAVPFEGGVAIGPRRFFFGAGPGEAVFAMGPVPVGHPAIVAVALEDCRLTRFPLQVGAEPEGPGRDMADAWTASWRAAVGDVPDAGPAGGPTTLAAFHRALFERVHAISRDESREECERFEARERRSREMTYQAVSELTTVLTPGEEAMPPGSALFLAAYVVGQAGGIRLRRPAGWREDDARTDPVDLIAAASHVRSRKVLLHDGWTRQDCGPLLAFTARERKPLALLPVAPGKYEVFDPTTRVRGPLVAGIAESLDPQAYVFYRPLPEEATSGVELIRFALRGRRRDLLILLAAAGAATLLGMFTPQATALLVDYAIPDADRGLLAQLGLGLAAAAFGAAAFRFTQGIAMMRVETGADVATQSAVWDRLLGLQLAFFRRFSTGDLLSRVTAISQMRAYLSGTTLRTLFSSVVALLNLGLLLYYSPTLTLVALAVVTVLASTGPVRAVDQASPQVLACGRTYGKLSKSVSESRGSSKCTEKQRATSL